MVEKTAGSQLLLLFLGRWLGRSHRRLREAAFPISIRDHPPHAYVLSLFGFRVGKKMRGVEKEGTISQEVN